LPEKVTTISFNRGNPSVDSFPTDHIKECAAAVLDADANTVLQYGGPAGYMPLREIIAAWYGVHAGEVMVSNGSLQILEFLATLLLHPGDAVFVEEPSYDRTIAIFRRHGANVVGIPLQPDGLDVESLAEQLRTETPKLFYMISDFQNPTGITASLAKREEIIRLAEEHDFWIVEDAPYRLLRYKGSHVPTVKSLRPNRVMHLSSFTKLMSPGLRVGYLVAPSDIIEALAPIAANTYVCPGLLAQGITYEFCRRGWLEPNIEKLKGIYGPKLETTVAALREHLSGADWIEPEGGYYVGLTLSEGMHTANLRERAQKVGLSLSDGQGFFPQGGGDRFLRLAFAGLLSSEIREGIARLAKLVSPSSR
jgi:2-aminoadipate transaminase